MPPLPISSKNPEWADMLKMGISSLWLGYAIVNKWFAVEIMGSAKVEFLGNLVYHAELSIFTQAPLRLLRPTISCSCQHQNDVRKGNASWLCDVLAFTFVCLLAWSRRIRCNMFPCDDRDLWLGLLETNSLLWRYNVVQCWYHSIFLVISPQDW